TGPRTPTSCVACSTISLSRSCSRRRSRRSACSSPSWAPYSWRQPSGSHCCGTAAPEGHALDIPGVSRRGARVLAMAFVALAGGCITAAAPASAVVRCLGACIAEVIDDTPRPAGAIGLIGDSVLIGLDPYIAGDLAAAGWGPIHYWAGTGTRVPADNPLGASTVLRLWRAQGFDPAVWIIGVGADDVAFVGSAVAASEADIDIMLDEIGPDRDVVMATIQHHNDGWAANWNQALRNVAARRRALHVVEWQAEADQHPSWWGGDGVHLSPTGYR